jgi:hypothetical protein
MARATKSVPPIIALLVYGAAGTAIAGTSAYVTSGTLTQTVVQCLKDMKSTAEKTGFTVAQETLIDKNGMAGDFHADKAGAPLHFTARCNSVSKTWGIAVSGINNDQTFSQYKKFYDLLP